MQTLRLKRLLQTHYSLLVPFPPPPPPPALPSTQEERATNPQRMSPSAAAGGATPFGLYRLCCGRSTRLPRISQSEKVDSASGQRAGPWTAAGLDAIEELSSDAAERDKDGVAPSGGRFRHSGGGMSHDAPFRLVGFSDPDPLNPQCWSIPRRACITGLLALLCTWVGACSSMNAVLWREMADDLGVHSEILASLDTAGFLVGFGAAAPLWAPLSELAGRTPIYLVSLALLTVFEVAVALSRSLVTRIVLRFLAGCAATTPLSNAGAAMGDLWNHDERSVAFGVFAVGGFLGPCLGPVIGGWIAQSEWCYRWADGVQAIGAAFLGLMCFALLPETYPPVLLAFKAAAIRKHNRAHGYLAPLEYTRRQVTFAHDFRLTLARPLIMLVREPIIACFCAYLTIVFIIMFGNLTGHGIIPINAYPFIFNPHPLSPGLSGSLFLSIALGLVISACFTPWARKDYLRQVQRAQAAGQAVQPEQRLRAAVVGTWAVPVSLYWAAWVCRPGVSIWASLGAQTLFGIGTLSCFYSTFLYCIDSYEHKAASALAALTFLRYPIAGAAVLFTPPMYRRLGPHVALTLLASLSLLLSFVPLLFYRYGARIRSWSRYAVH